MKYMVMVQGSQADYEAMEGRGTDSDPAWSESDIKAMIAFMSALNDELAESGELVAAEGLVAPSRTRLVTTDAEGRPVIEDNPYGANDVLPAGFWILDCDSLARVTEIAARVTRSPVPAGAPAHPVVIRPIEEEFGADM